MLDALTWPNAMSAMQAIMKNEGKEPAYEDWIAVRKFYLNYAPKQLATSIKKPKEQSFFRKMEFKSNKNFHSRSTLLHYEDESGQLVVGQQNGDYTIYESDRSFHNYFLSNVPTGYSGDYILGMGELGPSDDVNGALYSIRDTTYTSLVSWMNRAIYFEAVDLNNNEEDEFIICSFGSQSGGVITGELVLAYRENDQIIKSTLDSLPGATMTMTYDLNDDGLLDVIALFSQGNEVVKAYYSQGDLKYKSTVLASFSPVYGTNSFDLADVNGDGYVDLLITNGDNDDYSQMYKSYHGVRILLNNGKNRFEESFFYNINGANKVKSSDFDKDGDIDFVVLAMYPDAFSRPWETLIYFENRDGRGYRPSFFESTASDNWILMDIGDIDRDGDIDIITAANQGIHGLLPPSVQATWRDNKVGLQVWENQTIQ